MKKEYLPVFTEKSINSSLLALANKLKKNQTNNIIINHSFATNLTASLSNKPISSSSNLQLADVSNSLSVASPIIGESLGSKFNAKTDTINYYNNKATLENSKFLKKLEQTTTTTTKSGFEAVKLSLSTPSKEQKEITASLAFALRAKDKKNYNLSPASFSHGLVQSTPNIESLDKVNLNTKVDLTNFSFNKKIVLNTKDKISPLAFLTLPKDSTISLKKEKVERFGTSLKKDCNNKNSLTYIKSVLPTSFSKDQYSKYKNITLYNYISNISKSNNIINTNPNLSKKYGLLLKYNRGIGYNFLDKINFLRKNKNINLISEYKEETYKLLFYFFKSIYCLISKPTILFSPDKITIRLFYYLMIPKRKIFKLFSIKYNKNFKLKWFEKKSKVNNKRKKRLSDFKKVESIFNLNIDSAGKKFNFNRNININPNNIRLPFMKFKVRKAVSRLKSKPALIKKVYFDLINFNLVKVFHNKFLVITNILSKLFNKPVILEITRIHNFKFDTNILANAIQLVMKNKTKNPKLAINKVYKKKNIKILNDPNLISKNNIISFLSGLNIYINGRIMREPIIPRITTKKYEKGATATGKVNYLDTSFITKKNRKGAYTIKVKAAQNFF